MLDAESETPPAEIDLSGLKCPLPVLRTKKAMAPLAAGATLAILTTDPASAVDIPAFAKLAGYQLINSATTATGHRFVLRK